MLTLLMQTNRKYSVNDLAELLEAEPSTATSAHSTRQALSSRPAIGMYDLHKTHKSTDSSRNFCISTRKKP